MGKGQAPIGRPDYLDVQGQLGDLRQQYEMTDQQMADLRSQFDQARQTPSGGMGQEFGGMPQFGGQPNGTMPGLEEQARMRAEAMMRGDPVTMDYNPQREEMVNQYLQQMGQQPMGGMGGMNKPGTVSGLLQRGPAQRPNPFAGFAQGMGRGLGGFKRPL
jgi:hypothetical protein